MSAAESASRCDKCGEIVADIDAGFSPGMQAMGHECGGRWRRVMWDRASGAWEALRPGRKPLAEGAGKTARIGWRVLPATKAEWQAKADAAGLTLQAWAERALSRAK